jgi:hypothetical protein
MSFLYTPLELDVFAKFPKQVDFNPELSPLHKAVHWFGCMATSICAIGSSRTSFIPTIDQLISYYQFCIEKGWIVNNFLPLDGSKGEWYRMLVISAPNIITTYNDFFGIPGENKLEYLGTTGVQGHPEGSTHLLIEEATKYGSHFLLGDINEAGQISEVFNPYPNLENSGIRSLRWWKFTHIYPGQEYQRQ